MKKISIVIPVFNEETYIDGLLKSLGKIEYPKDNYEVVVVNDGSTDHTIDVIQRFPEVRLVNLPENMGRYSARKIGAEAARYSNILFVDSRSVVDPRILSVLDQTDAKVVIGYSLGQQTLGVFEVFYLSIRRRVFANFYKNLNQAVYLSVDNFDGMPKGTGVLYVEKTVLCEAFDDLSHLDLGKDSSDDTRLLKTIVQRVPILIHPGVKITNFGRTAFWANVQHLFQRGAKFVDYYFNPGLRNFWLVIIFPMFIMVGFVLAMFLAPVSFFIKIAALMGVDFIAALILSRTMREFLIILYMLPLCFTIFYSGIIRGIFLKFLTMKSERSE